MLLRQVRLSRPLEPLQIPYPPSFDPELKSGEESDLEIFIGQDFRFLSEAEVTVVDAYLLKLPYRQSLDKTGALILDQEDPLLGMDHDQLDEVEKRAGLPNTKVAISGGIRQPYERILITRERGYAGNGSLALQSSSANA